VRLFSLKGTACSREKLKKRGKKGWKVLMKKEGMNGLAAFSESQGSRRKKAGEREIDPNKPLVLLFKNTIAGKKNARGGVLWRGKKKD